MNDLVPDSPEQNPNANNAAPEPAPPPLSPVETARMDILIQLPPLMQRVNAGANWFFWIAALSLVNSAITHLGGGMVFVIGLGVTLIADAIAVLIAQEHPDAGMIAKGVAIGFDIFAALIVLGFGFLARRRYSAVFIVGMVLYLLDGLLILLNPSVMAIVFHVFALTCMWQGFQANRKLNALQHMLVHLDDGDDEEGNGHVT
jgi:hypothetical protein